MPVDGLRALAVWAVLAASLAVSAPAQQDRSGLIQLRSADELKGRVIGGAEVRELIGRVNFQQFLREGGLVKVWTDRALQFIEAEQVDLFGRVRVVRDSLVITSDEGQYFGRERRVEVRGNVRLVRTGSVLTSEAGEYFPDEKRAVFRGNVEVRDSVSVLFCRQLVYWEDEARSVATGDVRVVQLQDGTTVTGDTLVNLERQKRTVVEGSPRLMQTDTSAAGEVDTLIVESRRMESIDDTLRMLLAIDDVRLARSNLAGICRRATFFVAGDRITLAGDPVVWHERNQLTGDSIAIMLRDRKLSEVHVRGRAMAVSRADSLRMLRFDQLTGRNLTMRFEAGKVRQIDADGTATSLYYLYDEGTPNGMNISSGDRIIIEFADGVTERIRVVRGVEGSYYPERMIHLRESDYNLDGFRWVTPRPVRTGMTIDMKDVR